MSKQDFDSISFSNSTSNGGTQANKPQVAFFQLKNDGDEAVVRFMCDSTKDFEIFTTHITPTSNNRFMKVNCLRDANEPVSKCPLCESKNFKLSQTFCVPLIQYEKQSDGSVVKAIIADTKNQNDEGCNKWGHMNGQCVLEYVVDKNSWYGTNHSNPGTANCHPEWKQSINKAINYGNYFDK